MLSKVLAAPVDLTVLGAQIETLQKVAALATENPFLSQCTRLQNVASIELKGLSSITFLPNGTCIGLNGDGRIQYVTYHETDAASRFVYKIINEKGSLPPNVHLFSDGTQTGFYTLNENRELIHRPGLSNESRKVVGTIPEEIFRAIQKGLLKKMLVTDSHILFQINDRVHCCDKSGKNPTVLPVGGTVTDFIVDEEANRVLCTTKEGEIRWALIQQTLEAERSELQGVYLAPEKGGLTQIKRSQGSILFHAHCPSPDRHEVYLITHQDAAEATEVDAVGPGIGSKWLYSHKTAPVFSSLVPQPENPDVRLVFTAAHDLKVTAQVVDKESSTTHRPLLYQIRKNDNAGDPPIVDGCTVFSAEKSDLYVMTQVAEGRYKITLMRPNPEGIPQEISMQDIAAHHSKCFMRSGITKLTYGALASAGTKVADMASTAYQAAKGALFNALSV